MRIKLLYVVMLATQMLVGAKYVKAQNDTMQVNVDLTSLNKNTIAVEVFPPAIHTTSATFVIPKIIPGTYMKVNYIRNYSNVIGYDKLGNKLKVKQIKNTFVIDNAAALHRITYQVKHSFSGKRFWDNILACGGTIFSDSGFLLNYQLVTGYFLNHVNTPIQITVKHPAHLMASTSQKIISRSRMVDVFAVNNYEQLIDQPAMYHVPDTASFMVGGTSFNIAVHNKNNFHSADSLKPQLNKIMDSLLLFMGGFSMKEYHFLFFTVDDAKLGWITKAMLNAALEHKQSYVLTGVEPKDFQSLTPFINYITAHEFLHTWAPLHIHSQKTEPYPFDKPENLSAHLWLHEGVTDYLAAQFCTNYNFTHRNNLANHLSGAQKQKPRSFANSSRHIAESNIFNFISKVKQIGNAYSRGQVVSFCLDMELIKLSNGEQNLHSLMHKMSNTYTYGKPFSEDSLFYTLAQFSQPEIATFLNNYINGKTLPPYQHYFDLLGWAYFGKNQKNNSFGKLKLKYDRKTNQVYVYKNAKNSLGLQAGDSIAALPYSKIYYELYWPSSANDSLTFMVNRNGTSIQLSGLPVYKQKNKYARIKQLKNPTAQQMQYRIWYNRKRLADAN
ncbi:MAG: hypothetical protein KA501_11835 [Bacteroidia bacterium]|nr:hypothetical protein [Bacteroidia bacterium]